MDYSDRQTVLRAAYLLSQKQHRELYVFFSSPELSLIVSELPPPVGESHWKVVGGETYYHMAGTEGYAPYVP